FIKINDEVACPAKPATIHKSRSSVTMRTNTWLIVAIGLALCSPVQPQAGQTPSGQTAPSTTPDAQKSQPTAATTNTVYESATVLKATTRLVVLDVVAIDKKGNAVTDLERADFTVVEDGAEQQIRVFSFQQPALRSAGGATPPAPNLPSNVFTN